VRIRVGGVTLRLHTRGGRSRLRLPRELAAFRAGRGRDIDIELIAGPLPPLPAAPPAFVSGGLWTVYPRGRGLVYVVREPSPGAAARAVLVIDAARRHGRLFVPPRAPLALHYPLDELLFQHHLARHGGMEVHGCGIGWRGKALLFCGVSGAGKTTTAGLWHRRRGTEVLSDDRVIVRLRGGRPWAYGTPWHGSGRFASARGRPLEGIFFLARGRPSAAPMDAVAAAAELFARSFPPPWEAPAVGRVLDLCARVAGRVPAWRLRFRPDASAVATVLAALASRHTGVCRPATADLP